MNKFKVCIVGRLLVAQKLKQNVLSRQSVVLSYFSSYDSSNFTSDCSRGKKLFFNASTNTVFLEEKNFNALINPWTEFGRGVFKKVDGTTNVKNVSRNVM